MSKYVIRSQGFFYTDEYWSPTETFRRVGRATFETKKDADAAARELARKWLRVSTIGDFVFDDRKAEDAVRSYYQARWPDIELPRWLMDVRVPKHATDDEVDGLIVAMNVTFAKVYEVSSHASDINDEACEDLMYGPPARRG